MGLASKSTKKAKATEAAPRDLAPLFRFPKGDAAKETGDGDGGTTGLPHILNHFETKGDRDAFLTGLKGLQADYQEPDFRPTEKQSRWQTFKAFWKNPWERQRFLETLDMGMFGTLMGLFAFNVPFVALDHVLLVPLISLYVVLGSALINMWRHSAKANKNGKLALTAAEMAELLKSADNNPLTKDDNLASVMKGLIHAKQDQKARMRIIWTVMIAVAMAVLTTALAGLLVKQWIDAFAQFMPAPYLFLGAMGSFVIMGALKLGTLIEDYIKAPDAQRLLLKYKIGWAATDLAVTIGAMIVLGFFLLSPYGWGASAALSVTMTCFFVAKALVKLSEEVIMPKWAAWRQRVADRKALAANEIENTLEHGVDHKPNTSLDEVVEQLTADLENTPKTPPVLKRNEGALSNAPSDGGSRDVSESELDGMLAPASGQSTAALVASQHQSVFATGLEQRQGEEPAGTMERRSSQISLTPSFDSV